MANPDSNVNKLEDEWVWLEIFQTWLEELTKIENNENIPEAYRLRSKYYLEEIRGFLIHGKNKFEEPFGDKILVFFSTVERFTKTEKEKNWIATKENIIIADFEETKMPVKFV
jgi:hypothetical protein